MIDNSGENMLRQRDYDGADAVVDAVVELPCSNHSRSSFSSSSTSTAVEESDHYHAVSLGENHGMFMTRWGRLLLCTMGICISYLCYGVLQEQLFGARDNVGATFALVTQSVMNTAVALVWHGISLARQRDAAAPPLNHGMLLVTALCYVLAMGCSNEAIALVSYPVAVLAKSCKLLPTMMVTQVVEWSRRRHSIYSKQEWVAALAMSIGIVLFQYQQMLVPSSRTQSLWWYGMSLLLFSLLMDGMLSSCQNELKKTMSKYRVPNAAETMLFVNLYSLLYLIPYSMYSNQWTPGLDALFNSPVTSQPSTSLLARIVLISVAAASGQIFIFLTLSWFNPVVTTTITTTRKFCTILLSVYTFGHAFDPWQWLGIALVFTGLYFVIVLQTYSERTTQSVATDAAPRVKSE
jgi:solute carrier family 35 (UDP-galactose transporter), member B1